jgi:hypothetical protein
MLLLQSVWQAHERRKIITVADPRLLLNYQPFPLGDTPCDQGSFFRLQNTEGLTLVGLFMEGTTLTCLETYSDAKKRTLHVTTMHMHPCSSLSSESNNVAMNLSSSVTIEVNGFEVEKAMVKNLLHLGLLCCLSNPKEQPAIEDVIRILQEIGDIDDVDDVSTKVVIPHVPDIKPLGLYRSLEYSQIADSIEHSEILPTEIL